MKDSPAIQPVSFASPLRRVSDDTTGGGGAEGNPAISSDTGIRFGAAARLAGEALGTAFDHSA